MNTLDEILNALNIAADVAGAFPPTAVPAALIAKLVAIAQAAVNAHVAATGKPMDLSQLKQIAPVT